MGLTNSKTANRSASRPASTRGRTTERPKRESGAKVSVGHQSSSDSPPAAKPKRKSETETKRDSQLAEEQTAIAVKQERPVCTSKSILSEPEPVAAPPMSSESSQGEEKEKEDETDVFQEVTGNEIGLYLAEGHVGKEWTILQREEMLNTRRVTFDLQKDRYYSRFVYEHSRVVLGGGFLNKDVARGVAQETSEEPPEEELEETPRELSSEAATVYSDCGSILDAEGGVTEENSQEKAEMVVVNEEEDDEEEEDVLFPSYSGSTDGYDDEEEDDDDGDYVNASFVADSRYVCTQAPLGSTMGDFWRMVWEQQVRVVVMLTRLQEGERAKADRYWPTLDKMFKVYKGQFQVTILSEDEVVPDEIIVRRFALKDLRVSMSLSAEEEEDEEEEDEEEEEKVSEERTSEFEDMIDEDARVITQLHYIGWPDHGVPPNFIGILQMLQLLDEHERKAREKAKRAEMTLKQAEAAATGKMSCTKRKALAKVAVDAVWPTPIVVHCSAGVGRSGTFCAAHMEVERLHEVYVKQYGDETVTRERWRQLVSEEKLRIGPTVRRLREDRKTMVQREEQLAFLYKLFDYMCHSDDFQLVPFYSPSNACTLPKAMLT